MTAALFLALLLPGTSLAGGKGGRLSQVDSGLRHQTGQYERSAPSASTTSPQPDDDSLFLDDGDVIDPTSAGYVISSPGGRARRLPNADIDLSFSVQDVHESDGAFAVDLRASFARSAGIFIHARSFVEGEGQDQVSLTPWRGGITTRMSAPNASTELWVEAGLAGITGPDLSILGVSGGMSLRQPLTPWLTADATGHLTLYQDQIHSTDVGVGISVSVFRVGYRHMSWSVGPSLRGPEAGLSFRF